LIFIYQNPFEVAQTWFHSIATARPQVRFS